MTTETITSISEAEQGTSLWKDAWLRLRKNHLALFGLAVLSLFIVIALLTPWIAPYSYEAQNLELGASPPSARHWLGTDIFGRDLLTQIMYGGRISLAVGFVALAVRSFRASWDSAARTRRPLSRTTERRCSSGKRSSEAGPTETTIQGSSSRATPSGPVRRPAPTSKPAPSTASSQLAAPVSTPFST